jgi:hypothetical protein
VGNRRDCVKGAWPERRVELEADVDELSAALGRIESQLDAGAYRPGPWAKFLRDAEGRPRAERLKLADRASRVSDKLHRRRHPLTFSFRRGLWLELIATAVAVVLLEAGLRGPSGGSVLAAAVMLTVTLQPLVKIAIGHLLGVRYSYFYIWAHYEPRFKMRYGTYLCAERWQRVVLHASGTVGSPLAFWWVSVRAAEVAPRVSALCDVLFWLLVGVQVLTFLLGISGVRQLARVGWVTSGGAAARELRAWTSS